MTAKPRAHVFLFYPRFWPKILDGSKRQTIRPESKRRVAAGDLLDLRGWSDNPYRSRHVHLIVGLCVGVDHVSIEIRGLRLFIEIDGARIPRRDVLAFLRADGFEDLEDFLRWWLEVRRAPRLFQGTRYRWNTLESP